jgi:GNAT superfamily N-acetyltransferase
MGMLVRVAGLDDIHNLSVFFQEAWREAGPGALGFTGATDDVVHQLASEESLRTRLTDPNLRIFVVEGEDRILGFASMKRIDSAQVELSGIVVLQSLVGRGMGTELYLAARENAVVEGYNRVVVKTEVFNKTAISFYKKMGFFETREEVERVEGTDVRLTVLEANLP